VDLSELKAEARRLLDDPLQPGTPISIDGVSVANPAVVTAERHGLVTGQTATIAGRTGDTPDINGDHVVTVIDADTLSIPVNVTVSGGAVGTISGTDEDSLWSEAELTRFANLAEREAAMRSLCIIDDTTTQDADDKPICRISLTADPTTPVYEISPKVITIRHVQLASLNYPMTKDKRFGLQNENLANLPAGTPSRWSWARRLHYIVLNRKIEANDTLNLEVTRYPLADMSAADDEPEIPFHFHYSLVYGMLMYAYLKKDSETYDPAQAERFGKMFADVFGPPVSLQELTVKRQAVSRPQFIRHY